MEEATDIYFDPTSLLMGFKSLIASRPLLSPLPQNTQTYNTIFIVFDVNFRFCNFQFKDCMRMKEKN